MALSLRLIPRARNGCVRITLPKEFVDQYQLKGNGNETLDIIPHHIKLSDGTEINLQEVLVKGKVSGVFR